MRLHIGIRSLFCLWIALHSVLRADDFFLQEQRVTGPEMGEVVCYRLVCGTNQYSFMPPLDWRMQLERGQRRLVFQSPDRTASIFLAIAASNPALDPGADPELLGQELRQRFSRANFLEEFPCYTSSHSGRAFDLAWTTPSEVKMASRVAFFSAPGHSLEFTLTTLAGRIQNLRSVLGGLLTSFHQDGAAPAETVPRPSPKRDPGPNPRSS
jgi:hypothetical protein